MMRVKRFIISVMSGVILTTSITLFGREPLTIVSWGGAYEHSQNQAYFKPFTARFGSAITVRRYDGGIEELRRQVAANQVEWDLIDLTLADNLLACELGLLELIDHTRLAPAPDGTPAEQDFHAQALVPCGVPQIVSATVLAYNPNAFPGEKPNSINALFDLDKYPGKRALQKSPTANLEWALLSYGVPRQDIYALLSTERGLKLAFARLDKIKNHIVWWTQGSTPPELISRGEVSMASGYNGRFFNAATLKQQPIVIIWDGQLYDYATWGIPKGAPHYKRALQFIHFASDTQRLADQALYIAYGPARKSSAQQVWQHALSGIDIRPHLPTYPANLRRAIRKDHAWYAKTQQRLQQRFSTWLNAERQSN